MKINSKYKEIIEWQGSRYGEIDRISKGNRCDGCCFQRSEGYAHSSCVKPWFPFFNSCTESLRNDKCYIIYKKIS